MNWLEEWLASVVGSDNVFMVTWLLVTLGAFVFLGFLIFPRGPK